jgi:paraquat-inducible protein A
MSHYFSLIACHECDLLYKIDRSPNEGVAKCRRCGAILAKHERHKLEHTIALTITGLVLFAVANAFPILSLKFEEQLTETTLFDGVKSLYDQGMWPLAMLVFLTCIALPFARLAALLYVFLPIKFNRTPLKMAAIFKLIYSLRPWSMIEIFMLGILVSVVKLTALATVIPGVALWSFAVLIFVLAATATSLDPDLVWERLDAER